LTTASQSRASLASLAPLLLPALGFVALLGAVRALPGDSASLLRLLVTFAAAAVAALYRPAGVGLGAGTAALPLARALLGWGGATVVAAAAGAAIALVPPVVPPRERRSPRSRTRRALDEAALHAVAGAAAAAAWTLPLPLAGRCAAAAAVWLSLVTALPPLQRRLTGLPPLAPWWRPLGGLTLDAAGWAVGFLVLTVGQRAGWRLAALVLLACAALAGEAGRQRRLRQQAEGGRAALEQLGRAGERLVASPSASEDVAARVLQECRQVVPLSWFHLEITAPASAGGSWHAGADLQLGEGWPRVPAHPPPLPGVHRRAPWQLLERRLLSGGIELARLTLWCDPRRLRPEMLPLFEQLLPQLAGLVHRAVLDTQASEDPLTGVALRRVLDVRLRSALETSRETGRPIAVALLDLDFFKRVNDRYGHAAGDRALQAVAAVLRRHAREGDLCARYGGEEFTMLFDGLGGEAALSIVEHLRADVEALAVDHEGERLPLSVSAGVAAYPEVPSRTAEELLQVADAALYEAKRLGRNCCLLHTGRGRYRDGKGRAVETGESATPQAPQIFA
jgi:diguanylate cyclase (GGDEF)-like protein